MKSDKKHILILAVLHILILLFPMGAKISHHHTVENHCCDLPFKPSFNNHSEHCLVCDFECLPFKSSESYQIQLVDFATREFISPIGNNPFIELFNYSSLRAPPVA
jgi:hypothetical protein